jgi:hypothetical protein
LIGEWKDANTTLRRMRRSALVFDYTTQNGLVDQRRAAYMAHQHAVHPLDQHDELGPPWQDARARSKVAGLRRAAPKIVVGLAVVGLVAVALLLHGA